MSLPYMPFYVGDYLADTGHLSTIEHGAYLLLIMHYWRTGALPKDEAVLMRICRMNKREWDRYRYSLQALFRPDWSHKRIDAELDKGRQKSAARSQSGKTGAAIKALKNMDAHQAKASGLLKQPESESESEESSPLRSGDSCGELRSPPTNAGQNPGSEFLIEQDSPSGKIGEAESSQGAWRKDETKAGAKPTEIPRSGKADEPCRPAKPVKPKPDDVRQILESCVSPKSAADLIAHRKAKRAPMTPRAAVLLVESFKTFGNPEQAVQTMILRGWTGFDPSWIKGTQIGVGARTNGYDATRPALDLMRAIAARGPKTDVSGI